MRAISVISACFHFIFAGLNVASPKACFKRSNSVGAGNAIPLFTGDGRINVSSDWDTPGQVAVQQNNPLPMEVTAFIPEVVIGDTSG